MKNITDRFYEAMDRQLADIALSDLSLSEQHHRAILVCKKAMTKLKNYVSSYAFESITEEIHFFKTVKPQFYSRFIYHVNVYKYHIQIPLGGEEAQRAYINFHLADIQHFFDSNKAFYQYYRSGSTQMDEVYYTRGGFDVQMELEDFEEDEQYSTSHDYKLSKLIANEKFQDFLKLELAKIGNEEFSTLGKVFPFKHPQWTASQTDAVELLYALKTGLAVNNGNIDIAELVAIWEFIFQMEIHESYHKLLDITRRKKEVFVFLNRIMNSFWNFITEKFK